jgi:phosphate-selective porin OprO/OprP
VYRLFAKSIALIAILTFVKTATAVEHEEGSKSIVDTDGGLSVQTQDSNFTFKLGGRLQLDYNRYDGVLNTQSVPIDQVGDSEDRFFVRRARLSLKGTIYKDWFWLIEPSYSSSDEAWELQDVYLGYSGFGDLAKLTFGQQKQPISFALLMSSKYTALNERTALGKITENDLETGLLLKGANDTLTYGLGIFSAKDEIDGNDNYSLTGRATYSPINSETRLFHIGASYVNRDSRKDSSSPPLGIREGDKLKVQYDLSDNRQGFGVELVGKYGPFWIQTEYLRINSDAVLSGGKDVEVGDFYIESGWYLTGESRPYKEGIFKGIDPKSEYGAFEVVARYEHVDLSDDGITLVDKYATEFGTVTDNGNKIDIYTLGVNWYVTEYYRASLNYVNTKVDESIAGENDGHGLSARLWAYF